jgi:hypothetical protein
VLEEAKCQEMGFKRDQILVVDCDPYKVRSIKENSILLPVFEPSDAEEADASRQGEIMQFTANYIQSLF